MLVDQQFFQIFTFIGSSIICLSLSEIPIWTHQREFGDFQHNESLAPRETNRNLKSSYLKNMFFFNFYLMQQSWAFLRQASAWGSWADPLVRQVSLHRTHNYTYKICFKKPIIFQYFFVNYISVTSQSQFAHCAGNPIYVFP